MRYFILTLTFVSYILARIVADIKANSSILMRLKMTGIAQNKQKWLIFIVVPRIRVENQISRIS